MANHPPEEPAEVAEPEHSPLDAETRARRDAALRLVRKHGDPVLRSRALKVAAFDGNLRTACSSTASTPTARPRRS